MMEISLPLILHCTMPPPACPLLPALPHLYPACIHTHHTVSHHLLPFTPHTLPAFCHCYLACRRMVVTPSPLPHYHTTTMPALPHYLPCLQVQTHTLLLLPACLPSAWRWVGGWVGGQVFGVGGGGGGGVGGWVGGWVNLEGLDWRNNQINQMNLKNGNEA